MWNVLWFVLACAPQVARADSAEAWLDRIEAKAAQVQALTATMTYVREEGLFDDRQHRYGTLVYQAGPPAKFEARFDRLVVDDALHEMDKTYIFDGRHLVERDNDERIWSRWELAEEGGTVDLLALGEGPFALPLNMKKDRVLARFEVSVSEDGADQLVHLVLTPRADQGLAVTKVDLWFDRETLLPVRARQEEEEDVTEVALGEMVVNPAELATTFDTSPPPAEATNWQVNETRKTREPQESQESQEPREMGME